MKEGVLDDVTEFGDNRTRFQHTRRDFTYKKRQKTRPAGLNLTLRSQCMIESFGTKLTKSWKRVFLMM